MAREAGQKVSLAKASKLSGIAIWRLGYDTTAWWGALSKQVGNNVPKGGTVDGRPMARGTGTGTVTGTGTAGAARTSD